MIINEDHGRNALVKRIGRLEMVVQEAIAYLEPDANCRSYMDRMLLRGKLKAALLDRPQKVKGPEIT